MNQLLIETKYLIKMHNLKPTHIAGQNFLICEDVLEKIIKSSGVGKGDYVLEIGPGLGILTKQLVTRATKVLAVEYDQSVLPVLATLQLALDYLEIVNNDILGIKNMDLVTQLGNDIYRVIANIPYHITSRILRKFLSYEPKPRDLWLLVQKEVAERITAKPGNLSRLGISVQFYGQPEIIDIVGKECFHPQPKVDSAILSIKLHHQYFDSLQQFKITEKQFWSVVNGGFVGKRKTLINNLTNSLHLDKEQVTEKIVRMKLNENIRAQELTIDEWIELASILVL